jgi:membrane protease subunit HflC
MKKTVTVLVVIAVIVILFLITGPFYVIEEGEQAVVIRFGRIISIEQEAGLKIKVPFVDNVNKFPKKILAWDGESQRIPTKENQFIWVATTARWKITDPKLFYESVGTITGAQSRLDDVIDSAVRKIWNGDRGTGGANPRHRHHHRLRGDPDRPCRSLQ